MAIAVAAEEFPRRMEIEIVEIHRAERGSFVVRIGTGTCPWCGWGAMRAELGGRGFCPVPTCAGPILAVLRPGAQPDGGGER